MSLLQNSNAISAESGYDITDSLRLRSSASAYLSRTPTSASNQKTWTLSMWIKRGSSIGTSYSNIFSARTTTSGTYTIAQFASDKIQFVDNGGMNLSTTQVFRDPSAWYHLIFKIDTTQATASDRVKMYVNGEQITAFSTATYPAQNVNLNVNSTNTHLFAQNASSQYGDYYLAEVNFVDGQALDPTSFGKTNDNGVWSPIEYTGTYGTNGFYLPMKETTQATGFNTVTYTGNGTSQSIDGVGFSPDLVWLKYRSATGNNELYDTIRGAGKLLVSNQTSAETTNTAKLSSIDSDGFSVGNALSTNTNGGTYVAWCWDAGSSTVSNTDGTITSSVRANPATGFSVATYTGTGSGTVGHGLSTAPKVTIIKTRDSAFNWRFYTTAIDGSFDILYLDLTNAKSDLLAISPPTSSVFSATNLTGDLVAYNFAEVPGYSKFGSYTGNGSTSGPTVTTGFRPAFVMVKSSTLSPSQWTILDNTRSPSNPTDKVLYPNLSNAEADFDSIDFLDDGFQIKNTSGSNNSSGHTYIYMAFADTRDFQWNFDASGNKNNWTPNNINSNASSESTYDLMSDVPHIVNEDAGNFATWSRIRSGADLPLTNGNLTLDNTSGSTLFPQPSILTSGLKLYCEINIESSLNTNSYVGIGGQQYRADGSINSTSGYVAYGDSYTNGDIIGVAWDDINSTLEYFKNGVSQGSVAHTGFSSFVVARIANGERMSINYGQRPFKYTPPTGYKKLNTYNLPDSAVPDGSQYMNTVLYTGNGTGQSISGVGFSPDFVWLKSRNLNALHAVFDTVRGGTKRLRTNDTVAEDTSTALTTFDADGFTLGNDYSANNSGSTFVSWNWRGSDSTAVSNTDGTITSTVSANPTSGFSVVTYSGNNTAGSTIGHGLGKVPEMIIVKVRSANNAWQVRHANVPVTQTLQLENTTGAYTSAVWNNTSPTNSVFTVGTGQSINETGQTYVAYCFAEVEGFSKFDSYTGNGSTNGPFVYTGFRPAFVLIKRTDAGPSNWTIQDTSRDTYNVADGVLYPNVSNAETTSNAFDMLSNGFKLKNSTSENNASGGTYIYMAFAENPFKNSLAR